MSDRRPENPERLWKITATYGPDDDPMMWEEATVDEVLAFVRRGVESGTIKGEVVEDECPWCAGDGCWEESNPLPGYSPGPAPMTCPYCKGVGRVLVIPVSTEGET